MAEVGDLGALLADTRTYNKAIKIPDAKQQGEDLCAEMKQLGRLGVFSAPCELPYGVRKIKTRPIFKKRLSKTERGVLEGDDGGPGCFLQTFRVEFFDTFAPVARMISFRIIFALSAYLYLFIKSMGVDVALLNLDTLLWQGLLVLKLNKALYG